MQFHLPVFYNYFNEIDNAKTTPAISIKIRGDSSVKAEVPGARSATSESRDAKNIFETKVHPSAAEDKSQARKLNSQTPSNKQITEEQKQLGSWT